MYKNLVFPLLVATIASLPLEELIISNFTNPSLTITANATEYDQNKAKRWTDTAKFIGGIKVDENSHLAQLQQTGYWNEHAAFLDNAWSQLDTQQLAKVRNWSNSELAAINETNPVVFYPFSGPDFLYAYTFFPQGKEYVLIGLEPIGWIPPFTELSEAETNANLTEIRNSLYAILQWSFFRTNDMKEDMAQQGVLPYMFLFMARTNNQILDVEYVGINQEGNIEKFSEGMIPGVKITFLPEGES
jgi:hypothetical protein